MKSEQELIREAIGGSETAFSELYDRNIGSVRAICRSFVRSMETADELVLETFFAAYKALPTFKRKSKFSTWLISIACNLCRSHLRREARRKKLWPYIDEEELEAKSTSGIEPILESERKEIRERCLEKLPGNQRAAFELWVHGYAYEDIAHAMHSTVDRVRGLMQRALPAVRRCLEHFGMKPE